MISKELRQVIEDWYVLKTYGEAYENLHRDYQADIDHYFGATEQYVQVLSDNDWAALCKEWARDNGFIIKSGTTRGGFDCVTWGYSTEKEKNFESSSEPGAIFKATQWILDNKEN